MFYNWKNIITAFFVPVGSDGTEAHLSLMNKNITTAIYSTVVNFFAWRYCTICRQWNISLSTMKHESLYYTELKYTTKWITAYLKILSLGSQSFVSNTHGLLEYRWSRCHLLAGSHRKKRWLMTEKTNYIETSMATSYGWNDSVNY